MNSPESGSASPEEPKEPEQLGNPDVSIDWCLSVIEQHPERFESWCKKLKLSKEQFLQASLDAFQQNPRLGEIGKKYFESEALTDNQKMALYSWGKIQQGFENHNRHMGRVRKLISWIAPSWVSYMDTDMKKDILP